MILQVILEGIGLGVLLILVCAIGTRKGAVGMVHLYSPEVQERCVTLGLTTHVKIKQNIRFVVSCMKENTTKIKNIRQYLLATLYNASFTISSYYSALVQHDMAEGRI